MFSVTNHQCSACEKQSSVRIAVIKIQTVINTDGDVEKVTVLCCSGEGKSVQPQRKTLKHFFKKKIKGHRIAIISGNATAGDDIQHA